MVTSSVDGKRVDIPSYHAEVGQVIGVRENLKTSQQLKKRLKQLLDVQHS